MVDGTRVSHSATIFIAFDNQVTKLKENSSVFGGLIVGFQGCRKPQAVVKLDGFLQIIGGNCDVLYSGNPFVEIHVIYSF